MRNTVLFILILLFCSIGLSQGPLKPADGDFSIKYFKFESGEALPELRIHYATLGTPRRDKSGRVTNAVIINHGTGGSHEQFLGANFAGVLFGKGQLLDTEKYFIIIPDNIGQGRSSKPSDGMHAKFPHYCYHDMVRAQYQLLTEKLDVDHLRLVMGTSMAACMRGSGAKCTRISWTPRCRSPACRLRSRAATGTFAEW